ncbi:MAG: glycosyltransferase family 1 protein [Proteiniphilum sp.]|nr:glycosyltransferase family 1 protein [Proteiniphilum sp.]
MFPEIARFWFFEKIKTTWIYMQCVFFTSLIPHFLGRKEADKPALVRSERKDGKSKQKSILVDLSYMKDLYRGYGQIALNYGNYFKKNYNTQTCDYEVTLLLPKKYIGVFGNQVNYLSSSNWFRKHGPCLFPEFDIWHNLQFPARFKPCSKSTKYIFTIHDLNVLSLEYEKSQKHVARNYKRLARHIKRASIITTISNYSKKHIENNFNLDGKRLVLIYNGVEEISKKTACKPDLQINKTFFFSLSAFRPKKNFHVLLDMMKLMPDKHLYIAGNNKTEYGKMIKNRIETEEINNVSLLGTVSEEEKVWLYANCEAFLFPSLLEGFGLPVIEAMQFGKPVFSSEETSLKEIGGNFSYFWKNFNPYDMKQLIDENLEKFYHDRGLEEREKEYANSFTYEKHFAEYEKLYATV